MRRGGLMDQWETFAKANAEFYIHPDLGLDASTEEGRNQFFESGRSVTETLLARISPLLPSWDVAVEIGCGVGRLALPHAERFRVLRAVDVSPSMLARLMHNANEAGVSNIEPYLPHEEWDAPSSADYVYSWVVFQHIADQEIIDGYIRRTALTLRRGGVAQLHFDSRSRTFAYRVRNIMPDLLLPVRQRSGIRRIRRSPAGLLHLMASTGLEVVEEIQPGTENHIFVLRKV